LLQTLPTDWRRSGWLKPASAERDLAAFDADPKAARVYLWAAMIAAAALLGPTTMTEWAGLPLLLCTIARLRTTLNAARWAMVQPLYIALALFCIWQWTSLAWSPDVREGIKQAGATRWIWFYPLFFPVLRHRRMLIAAAMTGFLIGNATQLAHALGQALHIPALTWNRLPGRNSGWWDPVVGGTLLSGALGLHLASLFFCAGRGRVLGLLGTAITLLAIFATGTRGAWIASIGLIAITLILFTVKPHSSQREQHPRAGRVALALLVAGLFIATSVLALGSGVRHRLEQASSDLTAAIKDKNFSTDTGARLMMAWWGVQALGEHPVAGVGAGGFRAWSAAKLRAQGIDPASRDLHAHAHNALLHAGATTGLIGLGLALAIACYGIRNAWREGTLHAQGWPSELGPMLALIGLFLVSAFDTIHVNSQTSALLFLLLALSPGVTPRQLAAARA